MFYTLIMTGVCLCMLYVGYLKFNDDALFALAIGGAVSSNVYTASEYGINSGGIYFGIDSVIYTFFIAGLVIMLLDSGKTKAFNLMYNSVTAIMFSGIISFIVTLATEGYSTQISVKLLAYTISSLATVFAMYCIWWAFSKLKNKIKNTYILFALLCLIASLGNSILYFSIMALLNPAYISPNFWSALLGAYITKIICILLASLTYYLINVTKNLKGIATKKEHPKN